MAKDTDDAAAQRRARYEFKRKLEELRGIRGRGTELVTVYITPDKNLNDVTGQIASELAQAQNIKSKQTKKNVSSALESILGRLKSYKQVPGHGLVLMMGHKAASGDQTEMVQYVVEPPEPVPINIYRCDSTFYIEPLEKMVEAKDLFGLIVIDRQEASIGTLKGERVEMLRNVQSQVPRKHSKGGQSARRFERQIEEQANWFFSNIGEMASELFLGKENLAGILVGGPGATKNEWVEGGHLHHELQKKIIDTFDTGYTDDYGLRELVTNAHTALEQRGLTREKDLLQRLLKEIRKADGLFSYGEKEVREYLHLGAVDTLILSENLRKARAKLKCNQCGNTWEQTADDIEAFKSSPPQCPACSQARGQVVEAADLLEELGHLADEMGTKVEIVSTQTEEGQMLQNAFGGIAAILRYRPR